ncbi:MAG: hypothetical protein HY780_11020 [Chloroflexi bacterium]|nr:hypothetical protein [Chloroflexota bacterium]
MPVNLLYCEGLDQSPDIRVLAVILAGACAISPSGGKFGMGQRILVTRENKPGSVSVAGLMDRDWDKDLLLGMQTELTAFGFTSPRQFRERVLKGIEESQEDVWTWLPEWNQLRQEIISYSTTERE